MKKWLLIFGGILILYLSAIPNVLASDVTDELSLNNCLRNPSEESCRLTNEINATNYIYIGRKVTLDLNNQTINFNDINFGVLIYYADVTITNGTIVATGSKNNFSAITISNGASLNLEKMNVQGDNGYAINLYESSTESNNSVTVDKDSVITGNGKNAVIYSFGEKNHNTINIYGKVEIHNQDKDFTAINTTYNVHEADINIYEGANVSGGILQMSSGNVNIYGGDISGNTGIIMTKGNLLVMGGNITGTGDYKEFTPTSDFAVNSNGAAIYIEPTAEMNVEINGGHLNSTNSSALSAPSENGNENLTISINNGQFEGNSEHGDVLVINKKEFISGGQFENTENLEEYLANNLQFNSEGKVVKKPSSSSSSNKEENEKDEEDTEEDKTDSPVIAPETSGTQTSKPTEDVQNPNTNDNIYIYIILLISSALGVGLSLKYNFMEK